MMIDSNACLHFGIIKIDHASSLPPFFLYFFKRIWVLFQNGNNTLKIDEPDFSRDNRLL